MDAAYTIKDGTVEVSAPTMWEAAQLLDVARYGEKLPEPDAEHVRRLLHAVAPDVEPFPDIAGMTTQIDNAFAGQLAATRKAEAELKACRVALMDQQALAQSMAKHISELEERNEEQRLQLQHLRNATFVGQMKEHLADAAQRSGGDWIGKGMSAVDAGDVQAVPPLDTYFGTPVTPKLPTSIGKRMADGLLTIYEGRRIKLTGSDRGVIFDFTSSASAHSCLTMARAIVGDAIDNAMAREREACAKDVEECNPYAFSSDWWCRQLAVAIRSTPARNAAAAATPTPETPAHA